MSSEHGCPTPPSFPAADDLARAGQEAPTPDPYGAGAPAGRPVGPAGTVAWAMGFLAYIPIPFLGSLVTGVVMMLIGNGQKAKGEVARLNGRNAANWGFTYFILTIVLIGGALLIGVISSGGGGPVPDAAGVSAITLVMLWAFPLQIAHVVVTIMGTVKGSRGNVFNNRIAIPLLR